MEWKSISVLFPILISVINGDHQFRWRFPFQYPGRTFEDVLKEGYEPSDFLYIFTGDTQYWFPCTPENHGCQEATDYCIADKSKKNCAQQQSEYANRIQRISLERLIDRVGQLGLSVKGLVINGDLTDFGHQRELNRFQDDWTPGLKGVPVYPGLGNHDYANNVGECALDHCVHRMLKYFRSYVKTNLNLQPDARSISQGLKENTVGSMAYGWDECLPDNSKCVRFVQLNNYPTYAKHISGWLYDWKLLPSLNWLSFRLRNSTADTPMVLNFHDFDHAFGAQDKLKFQRLLESAVVNGTARPLAIFFAHIHQNVGVKDFWCVGGLRVPLIYSGSVPGNNYVLAHFSSNDLKRVFVLHVENDQFSTVEIDRIRNDDLRCE